MTLPPTAVELSRLEFDVVWEHLRLGGFPKVYRMLGHGRTQADRAHLVDQAWRSLRVKGLAGRRTLDPRLTDLLTVLAKPDREVDARMSHGERAVRALAGARGGQAAIGVLEMGTFRFSEITPGGLSRAVVGLLPAHPAGSGASVTLPSAAFSAACAASGERPRGLEAALRARGVRAEVVAQLLDALAGIAGAGQFGAARLDRWGMRHRSSHIIGFVDSDGGRFLLQLRPPPSGGERWTTVAPTDPLRLAGQIDRLLAELDRATAG